MFKSSRWAFIALIFACGIANAQNDSPVMPSTGRTEIADDFGKPFSLSVGHIKRGDGLIVPGKRIGPVELNATRKEIEAILEVPGATTKMDEDSNYSVWRWEKQPKEQGHTDFFLLIFQKDRVVQIETNARDFALPNGLSIQSPAADWTQLWNNQPERYAVMMSIIGTPIHRTWKQIGFALEVPWESRTPGDYPIRRMIVLPKNQLAKTTFSLLRNLKFAKSQNVAK